MVDDNDYYIKCFKEHVLDKLNVDDVVKELDSLLIDVTTTLNYKVDSMLVPRIALVCYEKPSDFCHRHLVADWLNKNGISCKEWSEEEVWLR